MAKPRPCKPPRSLGGQRLSGNDDLACVGSVKPAEQVQQCRLATPRAPEHGDDLVGPHVECCTVEHTTPGPAAADRLPDPAGLENGHRLTVAVRRGRASRWTPQA